MEYGYIKDTTIQAIADGIRDAGIVPKYKEVQIPFKFKTPNATGLDDPTPTEMHPYDGYRVAISTLPEAVSTEVHIKVGYLDKSVVTGLQGTIYFLQTNSSNGISPDCPYIDIYADSPREYTIKVPAAKFDIKLRGIFNAYPDWLALNITAYGLDNSGFRIWSKTDEIIKMTTEEIVEAINNCPPLPPKSAFKIKGNCKYAFYGGNWDWFVKNYGDRVSTESITDCEYMFENSTLKKIPFTINVDNPSSMNSMFNNMSSLTECPKIRGSLCAKTSWPYARACITSAYRLRDAEDLITPEMIEHVKDIKVTSSYGGGYQFKFTYCYSLRKVPSWWKLQKLNSESTVIPNSSIAGLYPSCFRGCYVLDEILDVPVWAGKGTATSNMFSDTFYQLHRVKDITFETNNGTPIVAKWKSQTIDLGTNSGIGYVFSSGNGSILNYNSGITEDTHVKTDEAYQALKNNPDYWTDHVSYSRYSHDSAVRTINSLPDTSAYLASAGGTNTIKFKKGSGAKTDGGDISNLTAEEIAVATAKGWTVSLV
jgi:hypothetical protein